MRKINRVGMVYGRLTVIAAAPNKGRYVSWLCKCSCGTEKVVIAPSLQSGNTISCGCYQIENSKQIHTTHGSVGTRLYKCWCSMKARCDNPNGKDYIHYGGRGISYTSLWKEFAPFKDWALSNGYTDGLTLERLNVDKGYSADNCEWITQADQTRNRRKQLAPASSKYVGVQLVKKTKTWKASITVNTRIITIGTYLTEQEAAEARNEYILLNNLTRYRLNEIN